jgi:hypothetical protein
MRYTIHRYLLSKVYAESAFFISAPLSFSMQCPHALVPLKPQLPERLHHFICITKKTCAGYQIGAGTTEIIPAA